ncbi:tail fiber domain-containing protein [Flavobacterium terrisoli]|uniref:tail fiber domain-containing protein n=1 Tax=Flavobacterium terrisoli TaxID=3242195 RepID=UPI002543DB35|nr:tail fiber domain-containing protein [Flavobacterium buctense]
MKRFLLSSTVLFLSYFANAQVGIGTTSPSSTLDVTAANPTGTATSIDGILIPRVDRQRAQSMTSIPTSTIIYVNSVATGTASGITAAVTAVGFYYYNGSAWTALTGSSSNAWNITGNTGVTSANYIGTGASTNVDVFFRRNNSVAGRIGLTNTGFGLGAIAASTLGAGANNTAIGHNALTTNTTGSNNVAVGQYALTAANGASGNVAVGQNALATTIGSNNVAIGLNALRYSTAGSAGTATNNTAVGTNALQGLNNGAANGNTVIGAEAMGTTTGDISYCTAVGYQALNAVTDVSGMRGLWNTAVGYQAGNNITTGENNLALGYGATVPSATTNGQIRLGNTAIGYAGVQVAWTITSDKRWKDNIKDSGLGLDFIKTLRPVSYTRNNDAKGKTEYGFIAQELEKAFIDAGDANNAVITKDDKGMLGVRYNDFISISVKAIQEQQAQIEELKKKNEELTKANEAIIKRLEALEKK